VRALTGTSSRGLAVWLLLAGHDQATLERAILLGQRGTFVHPEATTTLLARSGRTSSPQPHQIMIGQLDSQSRVSSFLLMLALRCCRTHRGNLLLPLPMCGTISRLPCDESGHAEPHHDALEALQIIRRLNRTSVKLIDDQKLGQLSPIRPLLLATFGSSTLLSSAVRGASLRRRLWQ